VYSVSIIKIAWKYLLEYERLWNIDKMDIDNWWKQYTSKPTSEQYGFIRDTFQQELPQEFFDKIDIDDVILGTKDGLENTKKFDQVLDFTKILQTYHPQLYKEYDEYFDNFLIDYYCYHNQKEKLLQPVTNFIRKPDKGIDYLFLSFKKLLFYSHTDLVDKIIEETFEIIYKSPNIISGAEYELAQVKLYITLEEAWLKNHGKIDWKRFRTSLKKYNFNFKEDFIISIDNGLNGEILSGNNCIQNFTKDRKNFIVTLEGYFLKYMAKKGFCFALSGWIWDQMVDFWTEYDGKKHRNPDEYFTVRKEDFDRYLGRLAGDIILDNTSELIAILWGSVYVYDFLKSVGIINDETYSTYRTVASMLKGDVIRGFVPKLWNSNFVHSWIKPDSISQNEFDAENRIFIKSYSFTSHKFAQFQSVISDEIKSIGDFSKHLLRPDALHQSKPKKIGRNEPCPCGSGKKYKKCCGKLV